MTPRFLAPILVIAFGASHAPAQDTVEKRVSYRVVSVDPRLITKTRETIAVGYENARSDVMGSVSLSFEESAKLRALLDGALTPSTNVPFCGHSPAYVIVQLEQGKAVAFVSICSLCQTWCAADGQLRVLDDSQLAPFLKSVLPLPTAFSKVEKLPDLYELDPEKSFLELPSPR